MKNSKIRKFQHGQTTRQFPSDSRPLIFVTLIFNNIFHKRHLIIRKNPYKSRRRELLAVSRPSGREVSQSESPSLPLALFPHPGLFRLNGSQGDGEHNVLDQRPPR